MCRKCGGYGGSVNLGGIADTLEITKGKDLVKYVTILFSHSMTTPL